MGRPTVRAERSIKCRPFVSIHTDWPRSTKELDSVGRICWAYVSFLANTGNAVRRIWLGVRTLYTQQLLYH